MILLIDYLMFQSLLSMKHDEQRLIFQVSLQYVLKFFIILSYSVMLPVFAYNIVHWQLEILIHWVWNSIHVCKICETEAFQKYDFCMSLKKTITIYRSTFNTPDGHLFCNFGWKYNNKYNKIRIISSFSNHSNFPSNPNG